MNQINLSNFIKSGARKVDGMLLRRNNDGNQLSAS